MQIAPEFAVLASIAKDYPVAAAVVLSLGLIVRLVLGILALRNPRLRSLQVGRRFSAKLDPPREPRRSRGGR